MTMPYISALDHLMLMVANIAQTVMFYYDILGMQGLQFMIANGSKRWALVLLVRRKLTCIWLGRSFPLHAVLPSSGSEDLCFLSSTH